MDLQDATYLGKCLGTSRLRFVCFGGIHKVLFWVEEFRVTGCLWVKDETLLDLFFHHSSAPLGKLYSLEI